NLLGERGWSNPDATNLVMQRFGASEEQANLMQQMMPNLDTISSQLSMQRRDEARQMARQKATAGTSWDAIKHRISTKIKHATTDWAEDLGVSVRDYFNEWADDFMDEMTGTYRVEVTKRSRDIFQAAARGDTSAQRLAGAVASQNRGRGGDSGIINPY